MYRTAASRLRSLKGRLGNRVPTRYASSSAAAVSKSSSGGLFGWLGGDQSKSCPPMNFPLPGVTIPDPLPDYVEPGKTKITTLANGVQIASESSVGPIASIGLYVDCGSIYENHITSGVTHLLERIAFKTTRNRSHLRLVREVEAIGGNVQASASREHMGYTFDALKTYVPQMVEILIDSVRNPAFLDWEVNETIERLKGELEEVNKNPQGLLIEAMHKSGYAGALANPLLAPSSAIHRLNSSVLEEFVAENYTAPRIVLVASGVEHEDLMSSAEPLLSDLPMVPKPNEPVSQYIGGDYRCQGEPGITHFALAFEVPGGWHQEQEAMIISVLQMLMGGGGSFSAGGPGKGMYSRLYLRVLNKHPEVQSFSAFSSIYNKTGLFGIQGTIGPEFAMKSIDIAVRELIALATPGEVQQVELDRAKQATKSVILMNLESSIITSEDIGRQILTYGERKPVEHFLKAVDGITLQDITSIAQKLISSPLTMGAYGDVANLPSYEAVSNKFSSYRK